ncbi:MAG: hypothetical protein ABW128_05875 [Rhizorhabdus sp.]
MGWLYMNRHHMGGHETPKAYLDDQFTYNRTLEDGSTRGMRILDSACVGNRVWYGAAQKIENDVPGDIVAIVCLVRWNPRDKENLHFGYKDMDETMGPCEDGCPERILKLLTPTTYEGALDWRRRCLARLRTRSRKIEDGMRIKLATPVTFTDGHVGDEFVVVKRGSSITFRRDKGFGRYRIRNFRELAWVVVPETRVHRTVFAPAPASATPA